MHSRPLATEPAVEAKDQKVYTVKAASIQWERPQEEDQADGRKDQ
jgi:hypothetical protein